MTHKSLRFVMIAVSTLFVASACSGFGSPDNAASDDARAGKIAESLFPGKANLIEHATKCEPFVLHDEQVGDKRFNARMQTYYGVENNLHHCHAAANEKEVAVRSFDGFKNKFLTAENVRADLEGEKLFVESKKGMPYLNSFAESLTVKKNLAARADAARSIAAVWKSSSDPYMCFVDSVPASESDPNNAAEYREACAKVFMAGVAVNAEKMNLPTDIAGAESLVVYTYYDALANPSDVVKVKKLDKAASVYRYALSSSLLKQGLRFENDADKQSDPQIKTEMYFNAAEAFLSAAILAPEQSKSVEQYNAVVEKYNEILRDAEQKRAAAAAKRFPKPSFSNASKKVTSSVKADLKKVRVKCDKNSMYLRPASGNNIFSDSPDDIQYQWMIICSVCGKDPADPKKCEDISFEL